MALLDKLKEISSVDVEILEMCEAAGGSPNPTIDDLRDNRRDLESAIAKDMADWNRVVGGDWVVCGPKLNDGRSNRTIDLNNLGTEEADIILSLWGSGKSYCDSVEHAMGVLDPEDSIRFSFVLPEHDTARGIVNAFKADLPPKELLVVLNAYRIARMARGNKDFYGSESVMLAGGMYPCDEINTQLLTNLRDVENRTQSADMIARIAVRNAAAVVPGYEHDNIRALYDLCHKIATMAFGVSPRPFVFTDALHYHIVTQNNFVNQPMDITMILLHNSKYIGGSLYYALDETRKQLKHAGHSWASGKVADHIWPIKHLRDALRAEETRIEGELHASIKRENG